MIYSRRIITCISVFKVITGEKKGDLISPSSYVFSGKLWLNDYLGFPVLAVAQEHDGHDIARP
jgi:hypothetical protein